MDVLLVDDHPFIHETLRAVVQKAMPGATVHAETQLDEALQRARMLGRVDLVLLDLGLPGYSGIEALVRFRKARPRDPVVIVSATEDADSVQSSINAGARGFIPKTSQPDVMVAAVQLVASGGIYVPPQVLRPGIAPTRASSARRKLKSLADAGLTRRQGEVLRLVAKGLSNRQIGRRLAISESTVKQHAHSAFQVLGVASRTEALTALARFGFEIG
jgi:DNA-binding NarL/FixJ family response regulator